MKMVAYFGVYLILDLLIGLTCSSSAQSTEAIVNQEKDGNLPRAGTVEPTTPINSPESMLNKTIEDAIMGGPSMHAPQAPGSSDQTGSFFSKIFNRNRLLLLTHNNFDVFLSG